MKKVERDAFDRKVLYYIRAKGTVCTNQVRQHFKVKWETANRAIERLVARKEVFYHPEMGDNPYFYSVLENTGVRESKKSKPAVEKRETEDEKYGYSVRLPSEFTRGTDSEIIEREGFVCHPLLKGKDLARTFGRAHLHGQFSVEIKQIGTCPETFAIPDLDVRGGWYSKPMKPVGNKCYYGHILFPYDRSPFNVQIMTKADGSMKTISIYVHPRYIFHEGIDWVANEEFHRQVEEVCAILERYGWRFGKAEMKGLLSLGLNDSDFAKQMPVNHIERADDPVIFDSSPGSSTEGCTEAEIVIKTEQDKERFKTLVETPDRIMNLERVSGEHTDAITLIHEESLTNSERIEVIDHTLDRLIDLANKNLTLSEMNTHAIANMGGIIPTDKEPELFASEKKGDVMYG